MSSLPPPGDGGGIPTTLINDDPSLLGPNASNAANKNPLSLGLDFLKGLGSNDRKVNRGTAAAEHTPGPCIPNHTSDPYTCIDRGPTFIYVLTVAGLR